VVATSKLPHLPKDSELATILIDQHAMNLLTIGETLFLRLVYPSTAGIDAASLYQEFLTDVAFPAYCASTNNNTLTPSWLKSHDAILVDGPVARRFLSFLADNLRRLHLLNCFCFSILLSVILIAYHDGFKANSN
jgi:hypothetical protein